VAAADHRDADATLDALGGLLAQVVVKEAHQGGDFRRGTLPVVARKSVESQRAHAQLEGGLDGAADGCGSPAVANYPRQTARGGPAAIAIHDDGHVERSCGLLPPGQAEIA